MSKNSSEFIDGAFSKFGLSNDLFKIIDTSIIVTARNTFTKENAEKSTPDDETGLLLPPESEEEDFNQRTPDLNELFAAGDPPESEGILVPRPHRLALCLDFGYVTVTTLHPRLDRRPVPFVKFGLDPDKVLSKSDDAGTEVGRGDPISGDLSSDPVLDPHSYSEAGIGLPISSDPEIPSSGNPVNYSYVGAVGRLSDILHISISEGRFPDSGELEPRTVKLGRRRTFNDLFGFSPGNPERQNLLFGRLELRGSTHFYMSDAFSAPLLFTRFEPAGEWDGTNAIGLPKRIDWVKPLISDPERLLITEPGEYGPTGRRLNSEMLNGDFRLHPDFRAFIPVVSFKEGTCDISNPTIIASGSFKAPEAHIDSRVDFFDDGDLTGGCAVFATHGGPECIIDSGCPYISCGEIGKATFQERFEKLADRVNCILGEIDRIYCLIACLQGSIRKSKLAVGAELTTSTDCCASFTP